jgi:predicted RND superfamily exporter protein
MWNPFLRFPRSSLLLTALLCIPFLLKLAGFEVSSESRVLLEGDQRNLTSYEKVKQILAGVEVVVLSLECPEVFSPTGIDAVRRVSEAFQNQPGVEDVKSLTHSVKPVRRGLRFEMIPLVPSEATAADLEKLKQFSLDHPLIRNVMVAADSKHTLITVTYRRSLATAESQRTLRQEVEATLLPFQREGLRFQILALPLIEEEISSTLRSDIRRFLPLAAIFLVAILWWTFGSLPILALVLANQFLLLAILPGIIESLGFTLNVFSVMLFPLLTGIHLAQLAHVYTAFQRSRLAGQGADEAIDVALNESFKSCSFSLITTAIGLLSLTASEVRQIREFGILGTVGVSLVFGMTFGPGLALLKVVFGRFRQPSPTEPGPDRLPEATSAWSRSMTASVEKHGKLIMGIAALGILVSWEGMGRIRTDIRAVEFLNLRSPTRQAVEELDRIYGGINVVQIELDSGVENGINQLAFLKYIESVQRYAESRPDISGAYSYAQLLAMVNQIWEGERRDAFKLPENPLLISLFVVALKTQDYPFLTALSDKSLRTAYLVIRTRDMPSERYLAVLEDIIGYARRNKPEKVTVSAAEGIHSIIEADRRIIRSQLSSAGITTLVIGVVLTILWRSPFLALLSLVTNAIPVAFVMAMAGFANIPLNSITIMVAAICLGIAVDDSIHFITHWRDEFRRGSSAVDAVLHTFQVKGRPIIFTSVIMICIFSIFWFSSFPPVVHFGLLSAIAFAGALVTVLFFLPAALSWRDRRK